jgi:hypothetical protein
MNIHTAFPDPAFQCSGVVSLITEVPNLRGNVSYFQSKSKICGHGQKNQISLNFIHRSQLGQRQTSWFGFWHQTLVAMVTG